MKRSPSLTTSLTSGAFLLAGLLVLAQTALAANPRHAAAEQSSGRQAQTGSASGTAMQGIAVDHTGGNGVRREDTGKSGDNPMYEGSGQADLKPNAGSSTVEYKDPEDMTTRYRPGNNKTTRSANDAASQGAGAVQPQSTQKKHIAGVKYEDRVSGENHGEAAGQSTTGRLDRKSASIVILADKGNERSTARNSAHATESLRTFSNAKTGENPLYEDSGKSGTNPLFEPGKQQSAGTSSNPSPSPETERRKLPGRMKSGSIIVRRGSNAPGFAVNEQGSSTAPVRRRR